jgi:DNA modification methylase
MSEPTWEIRVGDALELLREMPKESVRCVVTSPPYFGLRDYGMQAQIGMEPTLDDYLDRLLAVFAEVHRVLRSDGTLWLNIGDCYASKPRGSDSGWDKSRLNNPARVQKAQSASLRQSRHAASAAGAKQKDLMGVPWLLAFRLRDFGWYLRQEIIWSKRSAMPDPVKDRCTRSHEQVFMLAKSPRYYYDADAIAEDSVSDHGSGNVYARQERLSIGGRGQPHPWTDVGGRRNRRSVWTLSSQPFSKAHFATFPPKLVEPCILAGSEPGDVVLDPFAGAGTTGLVALRLERSFLGVELNPDYADLARDRIRDDAPLLNTPAEVAA